MSWTTFAIRVAVGASCSIGALAAGHQCASRRAFVCDTAELPIDPPNPNVPAWRTQGGRLVCVSGAAAEPISMPIVWNAENTRALWKQKQLDQMDPLEIGIAAASLGFYIAITLLLGVGP